MTKQAAIYARVSTDDQAEKGYSLPSQIEACQKFAEQKDFEVAAIYQDDISGQKAIAARPEGGRLQADIESGKIGRVIVYQVDRLSRDIVDLLTSVRDWLRLGIEIYSLDVGQVTSELDIVLVIKGWQGSDERKKIIERTSRGRNSKAKSGRAVGAGTPPYGYTYQGGELAIKESEAHVIRMIFDLYLNGGESGKPLSLYAISNHLTQMSIPTPSESKGWNRKHKTGVWTSSAIYWLITSETYCGVLHYGKNIGANGRGGKRPKEEQIAVIVPAIVSRETWEEAQARRAYNSRIARRRTKREYLLRGMIKCGCGYSMVGTKGRYYCVGRNTKSGCQEPLVLGRIIEPVTWAYVMELITSPEKFGERLRQAQAEEMQNSQPKQKDLEHVIALIEQAEKEADDIARAMTRTHGLIAARLEQQAFEVDRRYKALQDRQAELQEALQFEMTDRMIENLMQFREIVAAGLTNPTFEDKRRWLEILQVGVTVTNRQAVITCRLPHDPLIIDLEESSGQGGGGESGMPTESNTSRSLKKARQSRSSRQGRRCRNR